MVFFETQVNKRQVNQDRVFYMEYRVNHEAMVKTFLVADGMGGLSSGEKASAMAAEKWVLKLQRMTMSEEFLGRSLTEQIEALKVFSYRAVQEMNEEVYRELMDQGIDGGTTLTAGILFWDTLILVNCGDSPAFLWKEDGSLLRLTRDQNVAEALVRQGSIERGSQLYEQKKHMLTDYIGKYRKSEPHVLSMEYKKGEILLIGSDGAFGSLSEEEIRGIVAKGQENTDQIIGMIFRRANELGEEDNQTMILYMEEKKKKENQMEGSSKKRAFWKRRAV